MIEVTIRAAELVVAEVRLPDPPRDLRSFAMRQQSMADAHAFEQRIDQAVRMAVKAARLHFASVRAQIAEEDA